MPKETTASTLFFRESPNVFRRTRESGELRWPGSTYGNWVNRTFSGVPSLDRCAFTSPVARMCSTARWAEAIRSARASISPGVTLPSPNRFS